MEGSKSESRSLNGKLKMVSWLRAKAGLKISMGTTLFLGIRKMI